MGTGVGRGRGKKERRKKDITFVQSVVKFGLSITVSDVIDPGSV